MTHTSIFDESVFMDERYSSARERFGMFSSPGHASLSASPLARASVFPIDRPSRIFSLISSDSLDRKEKTLKSSSLSPDSVPKEMISQPILSKTLTPPRANHSAGRTAHSAGSSNTASQPPRSAAFTRSNLSIKAGSPL